MMAGNINPNVLTQTAPINDINGPIVGMATASATVKNYREYFMLLHHRSSLCVSCVKCMKKEWKRSTLTINENRVAYSATCLFFSGNLSRIFDQIMFIGT